jgi:hypothetical protein
MKSIALSSILFVMCTTGCMTQQVASLDADRIIAISRQAIAETRKDLNLADLEFIEIKHIYDANLKERMTIGFRHSPTSESKTTEDDEMSSIKTITRFKAVIVEMDNSGKIISIDDGGASSRIEIKSSTKQNAQHQPAPYFK